MQDVVVTKAEILPQCDCSICICTLFMCLPNLQELSLLLSSFTGKRRERFHFYRIPQTESTAEYIINKGFFYLFVSPRAAGQSCLSGACQLILIIS